VWEPGEPNLGVDTGMPPLRASVAPGHDPLQLAIAHQRAAGVSLHEEHQITHHVCPKRNPIKCNGRTASKEEWGNVLLDTQGGGRGAVVGGDGSTWQESLPPAMKPAQNMESVIMPG